MMIAKKTYSLLLALILSVISAPLTGIRVSAADWEYYLDYEITNEGTEVEITACDLSVSGTLDIPSEIEGLPVVSIGDWAFGNCSSLEGITIPDSVINIGECAFYGCISLTDISIPDSVTTIGIFAFVLCNMLEEINVSPNNAYYADIDGVLFNKEITSLIAYPSSKAVSSYTVPYGVTHIGDFAFAFCANVSNLTLPDSLEYIGVGAFVLCASLISIEIPYKVESIEDEAFFGCESLMSVNIAEGVTCIKAYVFNGCLSLDSISLPDSITSIESDVFYDTAYYNDENNWENGVLYIGRHLIQSDYGIASDYAVREGTLCIADKAFHDNNSLIKITVPASIKTVPLQAFSFCPSLETVIIAYGVEVIQDYAFYGCPKLKEIAVPNTVKNIGALAFGYDETQKVSGFTVYCCEGGAGEQYAVENEFSYVSVSSLLPINGSVFTVCDGTGTAVSASTGLRVSSLLSEFANANTAVCKNGDLLSAGAFAGTGCEIRLMSGGSTIDLLAIVIEGDINGDSSADSLDVFLMDGVLNGRFVLDGVYFSAANLDLADEALDINDFSAVMNRAVGKTE